MVGRLVVLVLLAACGSASRDRSSSAGDGGFGELPDAGPPADAAGPVTCGDVTCDEVPPPRCADGIEAIATGACEAGACAYPETTRACGSVGCCDDHCCVPEASNEVDYGAVVATGLVKTVPAGVTFDTRTDCTEDAALGRCGHRASVSDGDNACVCHVDELTIDDLAVTGDLALVILASRSITITGRVDLSAVGPIPGPGMRWLFASASTVGGAGGSFGVMGGASGGGAPPTPVHGTETLVPLVGGTQGQDSTSLGGGGGGALQLTAGERIDVSVGEIDVSGGGGAGGAAGLTGAGGGSGGGILIEAPEVTLGVLYATGGGGGAGGSNRRAGGMGGDGDLNAGLGGDPDDDHGCALGGYTRGGWGGAGVGNGGSPHGGPYDSVTQCFDTERVHQGGGGGGTGRIRVNSVESCVSCASTIPLATFGVLRLR